MKILNIEILSKHKEILNIKKICDEAGIQNSTMYKKMSLKRELTVAESAAIMDVLKENGIALIELT